MVAVHVVGGGVAGLTIASLLPSDWGVHLYEPRWDERRVPTLFGIYPDGQAVLDQVGVLSDLTEESIPVGEGRIFSGDGTLLTSMKLAEVRMVPHTTLIDLLQRHLPSHVTVHREEVSGPTALQAGAETIVVGADGVHSEVRKSYWGSSAHARKLNVTVVRGVTETGPRLEGLDGYWAAGGLFGMTPRPGGGINWFATVPQEHFETRQVALETLSRRWSEAPEALHEVLRHADPALTLVNELWEARFTRKLHREHAVLVGDAAHAMAPNVARGANEALLDAQELAEALAKYPPGKAFQVYQRKRHLRTQGMKIVSRMVHRMSSTRREGFRNRVLTLLP
ncbi:FAD-dependent monooxygenase [Nesterenkonia ebinurensis]|uniref:FAD-dependent monooxygenase n=1 Tax=Nesterenkonia ebinurensis TaxID=2608252 RepID=UPI00123C98BC|nr:FAD-dependent monooxygenase [Nesterenkonia ebinurensis]